MSTKIYDAYRIKNENLPKFLKQISKMSIEFRQIAAKEILERIQEEKVDIDSADFLKHHKGGRMSRFYEFYRNLDIGIWVNSDNYTYIKVFGDDDFSRKTEQLFRKIKYIKDYHYQNSCDSPKGISQKRFDERGDKWDEIINQGDGYTFKHLLNISLIPDFVEEMSLGELQWEVKKNTKKFK